MHNLIYILFLTLFFSCKKEEKKYSVSYKIVETSNNTPSYTVRYTLANGSIQSISTKANSWNSSVLNDYKGGAALTLQVEGSGGGKYEMYILVNRASDAKRIADDTNGPQSLETNLPN